MDLEKYFQLNESPFLISPDPRFLYLTEQVKEALAKTEYMVSKRVGPMYIYGPIGSGKTSILKRFHDKLGSDKNYTLSSIISPNIKTSNAFLRVIMDEYNVKTERAYDQSLKNFSHFLITQYKEKKTPLLLIDEAQNMSRDTLKLIHFLLNYETNTEKLLQIILVGQEELAQRILRYQELASRMFPIAINAMGRDDLKKMIEFRWMVAGGKVPPFEERCYDVIFSYSKGLPRDTVKVCGQALIYLFSKQRTLMTPIEIEEIAKSLNLTK